MSEPPGTEPDDIPPPRPPGGSRLLGVVLGVVYLGGFAALNRFVPALQVIGSPILWVPVVIVFLVAAVALTANPRTSNVGAGLMISLGIALVVGAGVCVALVSGIGRA